MHVRMYKSGHRMTEELHLVIHGAVNADEVDAGLLLGLPCMCENALVGLEKLRLADGFAPVAAWGTQASRKFTGSQCDFN